MTQTDPPSAADLRPPAFDVLWLDGRDLRAVPLAKRKVYLNSVVPYESPEVFKTMVVEEHGLALFEAVKRLDLEGIVAKRKADAHTPSTSWYKVFDPGYSQKEERGDRPQMGTTRGRQRTSRGDAEVAARLAWRTVRLTPQLMRPRLSASLLSAVCRRSCGRNLVTPARCQCQRQ